MEAAAREGVDEEVEEGGGDSVEGGLVGGRFEVDPSPTTPSNGGSSTGSNTGVELPLTSLAETSSNPSSWSSSCSSADACCSISFSPPSPPAALIAATPFPFPSLFLTHLGVTVGASPTAPSSFPPTPPSLLPVLFLLCILAGLGLAPLAVFPTIKLGLAART